MGGVVLALAERVAKFLNDQKIVHGGKYSTPHPSQYTTNKNKILIHCNECNHEWYQRPGDHIVNRAGCPECKKKTLSKLKNMSFEYISRFNKKHGLGTYDYSRCKFGNSEDKVEIGCKVPGHGYFWQTPYAHYTNNGCPLCAEEQKTKRFIEMNKNGMFTQDEILERFRIRDVHGVFGYDYVVYSGMSTKVDILCKIHDKIFGQTPTNHLAGHGCPLCANEAHTLTTEEFVDGYVKKFGDIYDHSKTVYMGCNQPITVTCRVEGHGDFVISKATGHITKGYGCPKCANSNKSRPERAIIEYLSTITEHEILESKTIPGSTLQMDAWIPALNLAIEHNGLHWHSEASKKDVGGKDYHLNKTVLCETNGIHLIHIYEDDWLYKEDIVKSLLNEVINGVSYIEPTKLKVKMVEDSIAEAFVNRNSLAIKDIYPVDYWFGIYDNKKLCSVMGIMETSEGYEIHRFCDAIDHKIYGSFGRLLEYVHENINPGVMIGYMDRGWHKTGMFDNCYTSNGFEYVGIVENRSYTFDAYERKRMISECMDSIDKESVIWDSGMFKYVWMKKS